MHLVPVDELLHWISTEIYPALRRIVGDDDLMQQITADKERLKSPLDDWSDRTVSGEDQQLEVERLAARVATLAATYVNQR